MNTTTQTLLTEVLDAHGGLDRWRRFSTVKARVVTGGFLWAMKGFPLDDSPRLITSDFRRQWTRVEPFGQAGWHMLYEPARVVIETEADEVVAQLDNPRKTFAGHAWETPWTPLQLGYFNGYAMWTYYNLPFVLANPGVETTEIPSIMDGASALRGMRVRFPQGIHSHSPDQRLYFDSSGLLRRQDYRVDVAGSARASHLVSDYVDVQGLLLATKRRVFMRNADGSLEWGKMPVSIDLSNFELTRA